MRYDEKIVDLHSIDLPDCTYRITTETRADDLAESIKNIGLINLPVLIGKNSDFTIVIGFRRIKACQSLGWSKIQARVLASDTRKIECVRLAISDNVLQRRLNLVEESRAYAMISGFVQDDRETAKAASALGLSDNPSFIKKIETICRLPRSIQEGILSSTISLPAALELALLPQEEGICFADLLNRLKLSLNKQREVIVLVKEIASRENVSIQDVFRETFLQETLLRKDLDRNHKARKIRYYLKKRRFPEITRTEKAFDACAKRLKLGSGAKLIPPRHFEGTTYTLSLTFDNLTELKNRRATLDHLIQNPDLGKILDRKYI